LGGNAAHYSWILRGILPDFKEIDFLAPTGTLVLKDPAPTLTPPAPFQWIKGHWRCEGYHYGALTDWFRQQAIRDTVPRWPPSKHGGAKGTKPDIIKTGGVVGLW
jgi:hypothetical protein